MKENGQHAACVIGRRACQIFTAVLLALGASATGFAQNATGNQGTMAARRARAEQHMAQGYRELKNNRYSNAASEFEAALDLNPRLEFRARFPLAVALFELHKLEQARKELETVQSEAGDRPDALYYLGRINLAEGDYADAIHNLAKASSAPPYPDTAYYLGRAYLKHGDLAQAEKWLRQAHKLAPHDYRVPEQLALLYEREGRSEEAKESFAETGRLEEQDAAVSRERINCVQALENSSLERARPVCEMLFDYDDAKKLTMLGTIYGQHGDYADALAPLRRAAELVPESPQIEYDLALDCFRLRRYAEAREALAGIVKRWPDLFEPNALMGVVLYRLGENSAAYRVLRHAHELDPQDAGTAGFLYEVSLALARQRKNPNAECLHYLKTAAALQPDNPSPHRLMAQIYSALGELQQATEERRKAERLSVLNRTNPR